MNHRDEYLKCLERFVQAAHHKRFKPFFATPTRKGEWVGRFQLTQNLAFMFAVLYKFTRCKQYGALARQYLLDFDMGSHFFSLMLGQAYEIIAPLLSRTEREDFSARWVNDVHDQLNKYVFRNQPDRRPMLRKWSRRDLDNHPLCACVYADYARKLFPAQARPHRYEAITDTLWAAWWARREYQEQASNYESFAEVYLCFWSELRGVTKEFYAAPSIRNMFRRNELMVSPAGIVTAYGDSENNSHAPAWMALFEKVATATRAGQLKQAAGDIFQHLLAVGWADMPDQLKRALRENIYRGRVIYGGHLQQIAWLGESILWTDNTLKCQPRQNQGGLAQRLKMNTILTPAQCRRLPETELVPAKAVLTAGSSDPNQRFYLVLSAGPKYYHDHADAGAIHIFSRGHSLLLGETGYFQHELLYHNLFYAQPAAWRQRPDDSPAHLFDGSQQGADRIEKLPSGTDRSFCRIRFRKYHNLPLSLTREIQMEPSGEVIVTDRVLAYQQGYIGGPIFHAQSVEQLKNNARSTPGYRLVYRELPFGGKDLCNPPPAILKVQFDEPQSLALVTAQLHFPTKYDSPRYRGFPCCHYKKIWKSGYGARRCVWGYCALKPQCETVFITRLIPETTKTYCARKN